MIKSNRKSNETIIHSGYRNRLRQYADNQHSDKNSQANRSQRSDRINSKASNASKNTSRQRAFNSRVGNPHASSIQAQSQVQRYPSSRITQKTKKSKQRHPSQPIPDIDKSQVVSQVNTQIQALNRLREEYQILKQVTSDDEYKFQSQIVNNSVNNDNHQPGQQSRRKYIFQSRESYPVEIITNKKLSGRKSSQRGDGGKKVNWNPEKQENHLSESENQEQSQKQGQGSQNRQQRSRNKSPSPQKKSLRSNFLSQQYLIQISSLQSALTQSSLKIEQLLTQSLKSKEKLKLNNSLIQTNHRLQNQLRFSKENQKYLKREIQMKQDEIKRYEKRLKVMKQTNQMLEKESDLKDKEISVLQQALINHNKLQKGSSMIKHEENPSQGSLKDNLANVQHAYKEALQKIKKIGEQNDKMKRQYDNQLKRSQIFTEQMKKSTVYESENIKSYFNEVNDSLKKQLQMAQQRVYQLELKVQKINFQLQTEQSKNTRLQQTISSKIQALKSPVFNASTSQQQILHRTNLQQSQSGKQIQQLRSELSHMHKQMTQIQRSSIQQSSSYTTELQYKVRQLQEMIKGQNAQKQAFFEEIHRIKSQNKRIIKENTDMRKQNQNLSRQSISNEKYIMLENEKIKLNTELERVKRQSMNGMVSSQMLQDHQLLISLSSIKEEYRKLQSSYLQRAKQLQKLKYDYSKLKHEFQQIQGTLFQTQSQLQEQNQFCCKLQQKIHQKQLKLIQLLNISQSNKTYNEKINELQKSHFQSELRLKEKDFLINQIELQHKKALSQQRQAINKLKLQLNQNIIEMINMRNIYEKSTKTATQQLSEFKRQLELKSTELESQQKHFLGLNKSDNQMAEHQLHLLQGKLYQILGQKETLLEGTIKMAHLEHQLKALIIKEKNNRKLTEQVDHLWMVKEAEYYNLNEILKMVNQKIKIQDN